VLSLHRPGEGLITNPGSDTMLNVGTHLIVLGTRDQLALLQNITKRVSNQHRITGSHTNAHTN